MKNSDNFEYAQRSVNVSDLWEFEFRWNLKALTFVNFDLELLIFNNLDWICKIGFYNANREFSEKLPILGFFPLDAAMVEVLSDDTTPLLKYAEFLSKRNLGFTSHRICIYSASSQYSPKPLPFKLEFI